MIKTNIKTDEYKLYDTGYYFELVDKGRNTEYWLYKKYYPIKLLILEFNNDWNSLADILEHISYSYNQDIEEFEQYIRENL